MSTEKEDSPLLDLVCGLIALLAYVMALAGVLFLIWPGLREIKSAWHYGHLHWDTAISLAALYTFLVIPFMLRRKD